MYKLIFKVTNFIRFKTKHLWLRVGRDSVKAAVGTGTLEGSQGCTCSRCYFPWRLFHLQSAIVRWEEKKLESTDQCMLLLPVFSILFWDSELSMLFQYLVVLMRTLRLKSSHFLCMIYLNFVLTAVWFQTDRYLQDIMGRDVKTNKS